MEFPDPSALEPVDAQSRLINLCVLVVGDRAAALLTGLREAGAGGQADALHEGGADAETATVRYLPYRLGQLKGWTVQTHLYGLENDGRLLETLRRYSTRADGAIVAEPEEAEAGEVTVALAVSLARSANAAPVAVFGNRRLAQRWATLTDAVPVHTADGTAESILPTLKALAAKMLPRVRGTG